MLARGRRQSRPSEWHLLSFMSAGFQQSFLACFARNGAQVRHRRTGAGRKRRRPCLFAVREDTFVAGELRESKPLGYTNSAKVTRLGIRCQQVGYMLSTKLGSRGAVLNGKYQRVAIVMPDNVYYVNCLGEFAQPRLQLCTSPPWLLTEPSGAANSHNLAALTTRTAGRWLKRRSVGRTQAGKRPANPIGVAPWTAI